MQRNNYKKVRKILWVILFANLTVALLKIVIGSIIKSASLTADGFHSLTDGSSNIVGLIGINLASKPVDEDHPYGHKKFEKLAGLFIAGMLFFLGGKTVMEAIWRFFNPVTPQISLESLIALIATLCINIFVCTYEYKQGKRLNSHILISDSLHTRSDVFVSAGVILTLILIRIGVPSAIDSLTSLVVAGFIFHASCEIFKTSSEALVDKAVVDTDKVRDIVMSFEKVRDAHDIRSRGSDDDMHIDMHIMTEPDMSIEESHVLIHDIEKKIREELNENAQVIVHFEPFELMMDTDNL